MSTRLDALIGRVTDPGLADLLKAAVAELQPRREFGLVFEHHLPETVELPGLPIRVGAKVRLLPKRGSTEARSGLVWLVTALDGGLADLVSLDGEKRVKRGVVDIVRVADFADPVYPGLRSTNRLQHDAADRPWHALINAENFHALQALEFTHPGAIDTIYIDPPYNTGSDDWIYNDRHVNPEDGFRHSKWLSFMERRLDLARRLLKPTGVIIVAIGDDEHHRLRMLLDQVFGERNFIANLTWQGGASALAKYTGGGVDYMLVYAKDEQALADAGVRWRETKPGLELAKSAARDAWNEAQGNADEATRLYRVALRKLRGQLEPAVFRYDQIDESGRPFQADNLANGAPRPNLQYDLLHPTTNKPVRMHPNGWRHTREKMEANVAAGLVLFGPDETTTARFKRLLSDQEEQVPYPTFNQARMPSSRRLEDVLGDRRFPFPKDSQVLMRWIGLVTPATG